MLVIDRPRRWLTAALAAALVAVLGAVELASPDPAAAIPGLMCVSDTWSMSYDPTKTAGAECPRGSVGGGGGGQITQPPGSDPVRLTELQRTETRSTTRHLPG